MSELKDLFYLGLGTAMLAKEKIEADAKEMIEKGKISKEQREEFISKAKEKAQAEEEIFQQKFKSTMKEIISDMGLVTKDDLDEIKEILKNK